ncbi:hypothetical protein [Rathayibacter sp. Leaf248]|uniref:hypothetical protein n=1 Tax=Rathayibacter sp. Leaf248 TaxID=2876555 RepID=UPI001E60C00D|nr:hypothetical protein [Rathayibacter sp. Leaf248]
MSDHPTDATPGGVQRRTIVAGASWTIPVVATAIGAPLAAASETTTENVLTFTENLYVPGADCRISGVTTTLTSPSGAPVAGELVTVAPPTGYAFADGTTTKTLPTDGSGSITWPDIVAKPGAGTFTLGATTPTAPATSADIVIVAEPTVFEYNATTRRSYPLRAVPVGSRALGGGYFQAPNGDIYDWKRSTPLVTGAGVALGYPGDGTYYLDFVKNGVATTWSSSGNGSRTYPHIPADAVPVGSSWFLSPDGRLWQWNRTSGPIATGVTSATGYVAQDGSFTVQFVNATGAHQATGYSTAITDFPQVGAGATAVGGGYFLRNGTLRYGNKIVATNVKSAVGYPSPLNNVRTDYADYVLENGEVWETANDSGTGNTTNKRLTAVPANAEPIGGGFFLSGTSLWSWYARVPGGSDVSSAVGYVTASDTQGYWTDFVVTPSGCIA